MIPLDSQGPVSNDQPLGRSLLRLVGGITNHALDYLIADITKAVTDKFIGEDADGSSIHLFFDVCSFMGACKAAYQAIDE